MEDVEVVVDSAEEVESKPQVKNGLKPGEIRITPNGNEVVVETKRWVAILEYCKYSDGSLRVGDRLFPPPLDGSSSQWGRTGQGGGGGGGTSSGRKGHSGTSGDGGRPRARTFIGSPGAASYKAETSEVMHDQFKVALSFGSSKFGGMDVVGGSYGSTPNSKTQRMFRSRVRPVVEEGGGKKSKKKGKQKKKGGEETPQQNFDRGGRPKPKSRRGRIED